MSSVIEPKQQRSQDTQRKLLASLHFCLQQKFFEHISIKELADNAGVSVGTFYRRFKNKESLLPMLYQDFGRDLDNWVTSQEQKRYGSLEETISALCTEMWEFLCVHKSTFRTLHLNSRLHSELITTDESVDRRVVYQRLINIIMLFEHEMAVDNKSEATGMVIYTMINNLLDKVLYAQLTPAIATDLVEKPFAEGLAKMLLAYLVHKN